MTTSNVIVIYPNHKQRMQIYQFTPPVQGEIFKKQALKKVEVYEDECLSPVEYKNYLLEKLDGASTLMICEDYRDYVQNNLAEYRNQAKIFKKLKEKNINLALIITSVPFNNVPYQSQLRALADLYNLNYRITDTSVKPKKEYTLLSMAAKLKSNRLEFGLRLGFFSSLWTGLATANYFSSVFVCAALCVSSFFFMTTVGILAMTLIIKLLQKYHEKKLQTKRVKNAGLFKDKAYHQENHVQSWLKKADFDLSRKDAAYYVKGFFNAEPSEEPSSPRNSQGSISPQNRARSTQSSP